MRPKTRIIAAMTAVLGGVGRVAVGGGVDSKTPAFPAHRRPPGGAAMFHAPSPAVPAEAGIDRAGVRAIARPFGLDDTAGLPAAPCLSGRIGAGIAATLPALEFVHRVERLVTERIAPGTVRCRGAAGRTIRLRSRGPLRARSHGRRVSAIMRP